MTRTGEALAVRLEAIWQLDHSASGALGPQTCQDFKACGITAQSHSSARVVMRCSGWVWKRKVVAMPKLPPPPPRQAQNRSGMGPRVAGQDLARRGDDFNGPRDYRRSCRKPALAR